MTRSEGHPWLNWFAWLTAFTTFLLIGLGGLVTSHEAGMAVPDWPTTYGYNMFLFPFHLWMGGIFYEHTHRLLASLVGLLTTILAVWLWRREPRAWLRWLGVGAFFAVVLQGVLGGLRVTLYKDQIGIFHATLAQAFFVTLCLIALFSCGWADKWIAALGQQAVSKRLRAMTVMATALILAQLALGATMRHQHAGLAVPDFPLAYGRLWPRTDAAFVERINQERTGLQDYKPITGLQITLHMVHRLTAILILVTVAGAAWGARREPIQNRSLVRLTDGWLALICVQALLGAATVWSNKAADVATSHVMVGALSLLAGTVLSVGLVVAERKAVAAVAQPAVSPDGLLPAASFSQPKPSAL